MPPYSHHLENNIILIDTAYVRAGLAACYLVVDSDRVAIIDTGVETTIMQIEAVLAGLGLSFEHVDYVVPTHVHLDHAGAAGGLMQRCSNANLIIHPYGSRHMIDPSKLIAGAQAVYGEQGLRETVGEILPVDAKRVIDADDGFRFIVGKRELEILDTPGHARHHFCVWDAQSRGFFSGDTFGLAYPELEVDGRSFIVPPTTPVQFDPDAWHGSIDKLMARQPERMYLTHFGELKEPQNYSDDLHRRIDALAEIALACKSEVAEMGDRVGEYLHQQLTEHGCKLSGKSLADIIELDLDIIVQGLKVWVERQSNT